MMVASSQALLDYLKEKKLDAKMQAETQQVYLLFKSEDDKEREFPLFFRFFQGNQFLQMIAFFPIQLDREAIPDVARLLHLLNKEIDLPGFGLDEIGGVAFFRLMMEIEKGEIAESKIDEGIKSVQSACLTFDKTVEAVAVQATTVDDLIKKAEDAVKGSS